LVAVAAIAGAKVYGVIERGGGFHGLDWEIRTGYRYPGGIVAAIVVLVILGRRILSSSSLLKLGDANVVGIAVAMTMMRIGCFLAGCCHGFPASVAWAVQFPAHSSAWDAQLRAGLIDERAVASLAVHPLQVYFGVASLAIAVVLFWYRSRRRYPGELVLLFFVLDGTAKFLLEFLRFDYAAHLQWMAAGMAVVGATVLVGKEIFERRQSEPRKRVEGEPSTSGEGHAPLAARRSVG
jgi:phosphatidylglycerol:prolipoprotein diacylglycerol transferase